MIDVKYLRAWLAILVLQSFGSIHTLLSTTNTNLFIRPVNDFGKRALVILVVITAVIRLLLLKSFENWDLQMLHIFTSVILAAQSLMEMFFFELYRISPYTTLNCVLNGLTALLFAVYITFLIEEPVVVQEQPRKSGRLFAKHYMEGNILNPPDIPEVRELRKRS